jgi:hydroxymethylbilane synthase
MTVVVIETSGDRRRDVPIEELGGQGVFVKEVQAAVLEGRADVAVHSAKDLPSVTPPGLTLAAVAERDDPRDALVGSTLADLPAGALVATGSVRRRAQLAWLRPDLTFTGLRGNVPTRLAAAGRDRVVVAAVAALHRLGLMGLLDERGGEVLDADLMLPQVAQGALAVECRAGDESVLALVTAIDSAPGQRAVSAERGFLARLGGGCDLPVGALATELASGELVIEGMLASADGRRVLRSRLVGAPAASGTGPRDGGDPAALGARLAEDLLEAGGADLLGDRYLAVP